MMKRTSPWLLATLALGALTWLALSERKRTERRKVVVALEMYAADHGHYPRSLALLLPRYLQVLPDRAHYQVAHQGEDYYLV
ncbi:hypothetical protein DYH09_19190 [bacterium CPR1]|nr:hypothetical protein [bacterium CPR1]